jgi:hypothetical protein
MIPYARLTPGPGFQARRALFYYGQRMATAPMVRRAVSFLIAATVRARQGGPVTWPRDGTCRTALADLRKEGLAMLPPLVPRVEIKRIADYFHGNMVAAPDGARLPVEQIPAGAAAADYSLETVLACPGLLTLVNAPRVLRIAADYLGCKPTISSIGVRWTFPFGRKATRFQSFHRDVDDWRFLKLFIYLSDVDAGSGPHSFVRRSHDAAFGLIMRAYTQLEIEARFGAHKIATVTGPMGTTFMADTLGVHCGGRPTTAPRLMLQVQYSLLPVFAFRYAPIEHEAPMVDAYCNRLLLRQRPGVRAKDALEPT